MRVRVSSPRYQTCLIMEERRGDRQAAEDRIAQIEAHHQMAALATAGQPSRTTASSYVVGRAELTPIRTS